MSAVPAGTWHGREVLGESFFGQRSHPSSFLFGRPLALGWAPSLAFMAGGSRRCGDGVGFPPVDGGSICSFLGTDCQWSQFTAWGTHSINMGMAIGSALLAVGLGRRAAT